MGAVIAGRKAPAIPEQGAVVFLIGMRINRLWQPWRWFPVFIAMPRMLAELKKHPEIGLVGRPRIFLSGRTILVWQQWTSFDALEGYARAADHLHFPNWKAFNRMTRNNSAVGIYHETYLVGASTAEGVYVNMPPFGLGGAFGTVAPEGHARTAAQRLGRATTAGGAPTDD